MRRLFVLALLAWLVPRVAWATGCAIVGTPTSGALSTGGNTTVTYSGTAGDTIVVGIMVDNNTATTVTDSNSNTYTSDNNAHVDANGSGVYQLRSFNIPSSISSVTINNSSNPGAYAVAEFSGGTNVLDLHPTGGSASGTAAWATPSSGTLTQASEIVWGLVGANTTASITLSSGPTNGYTLAGAFVNEPNGAGGQLGMAYLVTAATTSTSTTFTVSSSARSYNGTTTTYECTAAAPPPLVGFFMPGLP